MIFLLIALVYISAKNNFVSAQCYIQSSKLTSLCYSCEIISNFNFSDEWPGGDVLFNSSDCKYMNNRSSKVDIFISPNSCAAGSACNGSIGSPFDNLVKAFKYGWRSSAYLLNFFLLSNQGEGEEESSTHFINKLDYISDFQYLFRRFYADISISPLYCFSLNNTGCIKNPSLKPTIMIRTQTIYFFVTKNFWVTNITFDGADLIIERKKMINASNLKTRICSDSDLLLENSTCYLKGVDSPPFKADSWGLFNIEPPIDCSSCTAATKQEKLLLEGTEFKNFHSFGSEGELYFGSLITVQTLRFYVKIKNSLIHKLFLPNGVISSIPMPEVYFIKQLAYDTAKNDNKEKILIFDTSILKDYNFYQVAPNMNDPYVCIFIQFSQIAFDIYLNYSAFHDISLQIGTNKLSYFILTSVLDFDEKLNNSISMNNNQFNNISVNYLVVFKKYLDGFKISVGSILSNNFSNMKNGCFDFYTTNVYYRDNDFTNYFIDSGSLFEMTNGFLFLNNNNFNSIEDVFKGTLALFKGDQVYPDKTIFVNTSVTNKCRTEAILIEDTLFYKIKAGIISSNTILNFFIFRRNRVFELNNANVNVSKGKVEGDLIIYMNEFSSILAMSLFNFETFKNFTMVNNTLIDVGVAWVMRTTLFSPNPPFYTITLRDNFIHSLTFSDTGFHIVRFSVETGINYVIENNHIENIEGTTEEAFFSLWFSSVVFNNNYIKSLARTTLIKIYALESGPLQVGITGSFMEGSSILSMEYFLFIVDFARLAIKDCIFYGHGILNSRMAMAYILSTTGSLSIENCTFEKLSSVTTGALMIKLGLLRDFKIFNCQFLYNSANDLSGDITIEFVTKEPGFLSIPIYIIEQSTVDYGIVNNTFRNSRGGTGGSLKILESSQMLLIGNKFIDSYGLKGGSIYISQRCQVISKGDYFYQGEADSSGGFFDINEGYLKLSDVTFENSYSPLGGVLYAESSSVSLSYVKITNSSGDKGGAINAQASSLFIFSLFCSNTVAKLDGGAIFFKSGNIKIKMSHFNKSKSNYQGGCLLLDNLDNIYAENVEFSNSTTAFDGIVLINGAEGKIYFLSDIKCFGNQVGGKGECLYMNEGSYSLKRVQIRYNQCGFCSLCLDSLTKNSFAYIDNVIILNNYFENSAILVNGFRVGLKNLSFSACKLHSRFTFLSLNSATFYSEDVTFEVSDLAGRFIYAESSFIQIIMARLNLLGKMAGVIAIKGSDLYFQEIIMIKAQCNIEEDGYGGAFHLEESSLTLGYSKISGSRAILGDTIFSIDGNIKIFNSLISGSEGNYNGVSIYLTSTAEAVNLRAGFIASDVSIFNSPGFKSKNQKYIEFNKVKFDQSREPAAFTNGISLEDTSNLVLANSIFHGINSDLSSALQIKSNKTALNLSINFIQVEFCESSGSGGGLRIEGLVYGKISNSIFKNNTSKESGGALYLNIKLGSSEMTIEKCLFLKNKAIKYGNILKTVDNLPTFKDENSDLSSEISSYPEKFIILSGSDWDITELSKNIISLGVESYKQYFLNELKNIASGQAIELTLIIVDHYENLLFLDVTGKVSFSNPRSSSQEISFENEGVRAKYGIGIFNELRIIAEPENDYEIRINYYDELTRREFSQSLSIHMRACIKGEVYSGMRCQICQKNFYSLEYEPLKHKTLACQQCKANSICPGGSQIFPEEGYWRKDENQTLVLKCKMREACPAYNVENISLVTFRFEPTCSSKYRGNICFGCINKHGKADTKECILCSMSLSFILKYVFLVMFSLTISAYQIWTAFSVDVTWSKRRCLLKLLIDHFTYIGLLSRFNIDWTATIQTLLNINDSYLTVVPAEMFNFDCFISQFVESDEKFSLNSILVSVSPFFYGFINLLMVYFAKGPILLWKRLLLCLKNRKRQQILSNFGKVITVQTKPTTKPTETTKKQKEPGIIQNVFATALIIFYNFYPRLLMNGMTWLRCIDIDDTRTKVLENNPDTFCWTNNHIKYVMAISIPTMVGWSICTPLILFYLTVRMKRNVRSGKSTMWEQLMDFISIDYQDRYYYWDLFSYISKFIVVFCAMVTNGLEPASQGALLILMMLGVFLVQEKLRPYKYGFVNDMFTSSYIVTICTAAFAIMASTRGLTEDQRFIYMLFLIAINLLFYLAWGFYFIKEGADWEASRSLMRDYIQRVSQNVSARLSRASRTSNINRNSAIKILSPTKKVSQLTISTGKKSLQVQQVVSRPSVFKN